MSDWIDTNDKSQSPEKDVLVEVKRFSDSISNASHPGYGTGQWQEYTMCHSELSDFTNAFVCDLVSHGQVIAWRPMDIEEISKVALEQIAKNLKYESIIRDLLIKLKRALQDEIKVNEDNHFWHERVLQEILELDEQFNKETETETETETEIKHPPATKAMENWLKGGGLDILPFLKEGDSC